MKTTQNQKLAEMLTANAAAFRRKITEFDNNVSGVKDFQVRDALERLDASLTRLFDADCLRVKDFMHLDGLLLNRFEKYVFV